MGQEGALRAAVWRILALYVNFTAPDGAALIIELDFSNTLTKAQIEEMATVDEYEAVKEVQVRRSLRLSRSKRDCVVSNHLQW